MMGFGSMGRGPMGRGRMMRGSLDEEEAGKLYDHGVVVRLMAFVIPYWRYLLLAIVAVVFYTGSVAALPYLVKVAIDSYIRPGDITGLRWVVAAFIIIAGLQFVSQYTHQRIMAYVGQRVLYTLRVTMFNHLQRLSMSYYDRYQVGSIMSRVQNDVPAAPGVPGRLRHDAGRRAEHRRHRGSHVHDERQAGDDHPLRGAPSGDRAHGLAALRPALFHAGPVRHR